MTNYAYKKDIPASNHNPSVDQPDMKTNTNSIQNLIGEDHYTFGVANGGFHKQMRIPALAAVGNLAPRIANSGTLWTQVNTSEGVSTETNLHYIPATGANDYQLTRTIAAKFAQFSTSATYGTPPGATTWTGGWTFLPGGLLLQYGNVVPSAANITVAFPVAFTNVPYSIQISFSSTASAGSLISVVAPATPTGFTTANNTNKISFAWMAIGK